MTDRNTQPLTLDDFELFYASLYDQNPFAWQVRLARQVCREGWPSFIKLPTASGKTAAIDIAVFSLAYQAAVSNRPGGMLTAARRIFFVVDRRIIVNEAYRRATVAAKRLRDASQLEPNHAVSDDNRRILSQVAFWLRSLTADDRAPPLDCFELRGGIYRNDAWVRSLLQPTVLTSTVDQVGSRLLFRGYGVADTSLSLHAGLTGNDSLIILDEAHCSRPFSQTMASIQRYRSKKWSTDEVRTPLSFVQMTATPPVGMEGSLVFQLTEEDYRVDAILERRHACEKPVKLVQVQGAKGAKLVKSLASKLVDEATELVTTKYCKKIAIVVNRIAIAKACFAELEKKHPGNVHLMIGRMRPVDRDKLTALLQSEFGSKSASTRSNSSSQSLPRFVVATQCLEVGADLDFDGMVSQCASLDALRQRFGRLNRLGETAGACGVIVAAEGDVPSDEKLDPAKPIDPIYGNSLAKTWRWLTEVSRSSQVKKPEPSMNTNQCWRECFVDFGVNSLDSHIPNGDDLAELLAPIADAPVLMPAHVDMLCQTSPRPMLEPDIDAYLHGPNRKSPEVRVCWRADLDLSFPEAIAQRWTEAVDLVPPSTSECLAVPLNLFRQWLRGENSADLTGDVMGEWMEPSDQEELQKNPLYSSARQVLVWLGNSKNINAPSRTTFVADANSSHLVRANDTIVIPVEYGGWNVFGHIPSAPSEPTAPPPETFRALMGGTDNPILLAESRRLAQVDIADEAFLGTRARTLFRAHPKLSVESELQMLADELLASSKSDNCDFSLDRWRDKASEIRKQIFGDELAIEGKVAPTIVRLTNWLDGEIGGKIVRYPSGIAWITEKHETLTRSEILPLPTFGDDPEELLNQEKVSLIQHLSDVHAEARRLIEGAGITGVLAESIHRASKFHDIGKADPRFQAMLIGKPISIAYMQPQLWAKSEQPRTRSITGLPKGFRHEMLSMQLLECFADARETIDDDLIAHLVAAHHGYARPFAPTCVDEEPESVNLESFGVAIVSAEARRRYISAHRLNSGVAERFWKLNRKFGWWGVAFLESVVRLADWQASSFPAKAKELLQFSVRKAHETSLSANLHSRPTLVLEGLDGSNPLAFLAALGTFRSLVLYLPDWDFKLNWAMVNGAWRPVLSASSRNEISKQSILDSLEKCLNVSSEEHPSVRLAVLVDAYGTPKCFHDVLYSSSYTSREDAEWLSCNSSDLTESSAISQLQTTRRDYHPINVKGLLKETKRDHLHRTLFQTWDYSDPIDGLSLHLEPREDRRHAYQWHTPSGDPTRKTNGGMIGANRLALEAWPLFQSLPSGDKLVTVGFRGMKANNTRFYWPIWSEPIGLDVLRSLLSLRSLDTSDEDETAEIHAMGIKVVFRSRRILVGKTPNLTAPEPTLMAW